MKVRKCQFVARLHLVLLCVGVAQASELDADFLHGVSGVPPIFKSGVSYPSGEYYVDVLINGEKTGRMQLIISQADEAAGRLCLSSEWLRSAGIFVKPEPYLSSFDEGRDCYVLANDSHTKVEFDFGTQALGFVIPQAYLLDKTDRALWDYGIDGFRLTYNGNFNKSTDSAVNAFGSFNASLNLGRWVLTSDMNASRNSNESQFQTNNITLSTALSEMQGDLLLGRSQARTELFSDFSFYGAALRSNRNMRPRSVNGYAPIASGVATSTSRITITQGGYTIYSKVVPPGPYSLDDISPIGSGDLLVTIEDSNGVKTVQELPVTTLPSLLHPGEANYNVAVGKKSTSSDIKDAFSSEQGTFLLGSYDYGLPALTLNMASILSNDYQSVGAGVTLPLGAWGALSTSGNLSKAMFDNDMKKQGGSVALKYAKNFGQRTDLQLLTYRYQTQGYTEYADFQPDSSDTFDREKSRYEAILSHRFDEMYLSASYWQQEYWNRSGHSSGLNVSGSTSFYGASLFLSGNHTRNEWDGSPDYSVSLGVSVPFDVGSTSYYSSNSVGYSSAGGAAFNAGVSATVNDRFNYSLNGNVDAKGNNGASASASYAFDTIQTNFQVAQTGDQTSVSGNVSGAAIVTEKTGLILTKESSDTVAVVKIKDTPGVTFNGSLPTNEAGETVVHLSDYDPSSININMDNVPDSMELVNTSFNVLPTERAIIYREFESKQVLRYILRLKDRQGKVLNGGIAQTEQKLDAGFVTNNGVLLMNMLSAPKRVTVTRGDGQLCRFDMNNAKPNTGSMQEVRCE